MFELMLQSGYWYMFLQVLVTLVLLPIYSFKRLTDNVHAYSEIYCTAAKADLYGYQHQKRKTDAHFGISVLSICFCNSSARKTK